jgi:hypothetical protein
MSIILQVFIKLALKASTRHVHEVIAGVLRCSMGDLRDIQRTISYAYAALFEVGALFYLGVATACVDSEFVSVGVSSVFGAHLEEGIGFLNSWCWLLSLINMLTRRHQSTNGTPSLILSQLKPQTLTCLMNLLQLLHFNMPRYLFIVQELRLGGLDCAVFLMGDVFLIILFTWIGIISI